MTEHPPLSPEDRARIAAEQAALNRQAMVLMAQENPMNVVPIKRNGGGGSSHDPAPDLPPLPPLEAYQDDEPVDSSSRETNENAQIAEPEAKLRFRHISEIIAEKREPDWLLDDVIEANVLAVLAGKRGSFKSFVALDWAMRVAQTGQAVGILSGEGAGLDRRADAWIRTHAPDTELMDLPLFAIERAINLNSASDMDRLQAATDDLDKAPALIVVDTLAKFSAGLDENSNSEVSEYLARLSWAIRDKYECTVLLVAHSGHSEDARPRGASALMANPDAEYMISRQSPVAMNVTVSRERFKDCPAMPPLGYEATIVDLGRLDKRGQPVTSLALKTSDVVTQAPSKRNGVNQERALTALRELHRANPDCTFLSSIDMQALCKAQGINRKRRIEVVAFLVSTGILTPSIGGHTFDPTNL
jgi:hypothetical protein